MVLSCYYCPATTTSVKEGWQGRLTVRTLLGQDDYGVCHVTGLLLHLARVARPLVCNQTQRGCSSNT